MVLDSFVCPCVLSCRLSPVHNLDLGLSHPQFEGPPRYTRWTHRWTQRCSVGSLAPAASSTTCLNLSSHDPIPPQFMFDGAVNDRYVALSHRTIKQWSWRRRQTRSWSWSRVVARPMPAMLVCLLVCWMCGVCQGHRHNVLLLLALPGPRQIPSRFGADSSESADSDARRYQQI